MIIRETKCIVCKSELTTEEASDFCPECGNGPMCMGCMEDHDCEEE